MEKLTEKQIYDALDFGNQVELPLNSFAKDEVVSRLIKAGLVKKETIVKYGVLFNKLTKEFETCAYNDELMIKNTTHVIIAADLELSKASFLTKKYNEVSL